MEGWVGEMRNNGLPRGLDEVTHTRRQSCPPFPRIRCGSPHRGLELDSTPHELSAYPNHARIDVFKNLKVHGMSHRVPSSLTACRPPPTQTFKKRTSEYLSRANELERSLEATCGEQVRPQPRL
jgi:hypothetical protein